MQNTYAIISYNSSRTEEWKLALHDEGNQLTESSFVDLEVSESDGIRTVIVKRPYNFGTNYYDFTPFITATETSIDIIAGMIYIYIMCILYATISILLYSIWTSR